MIKIKLTNLFSKYIQLMKDKKMQKLSITLNDVDVELQENRKKD